MVLALGDSVPAGSACSCTPFPALYAQAISVASAARTVSINAGRPGLTSTGLVGLLGNGTPESDDVARSAVITITIGANDFDYVPSAQCPKLSCYAAALHTLAVNVAAILGRINQLRASQPTAVRITGYWEIWKDGAIGAQLGTDYMQVNDALTDAVNRLLAHAASDTDAGYVDLQAAFHRTTDTDLLAADGDHPDAAGHRMIAGLLQASGLHPLSLIWLPAS